MKFFMPARLNMESPGYNIFGTKKILLLLPRFIAVDMMIS